MTHSQAKWILTLLFYSALPLPYTDFLATSGFLPPALIVGSILIVTPAIIFALAYAVLLYWLASALSGKVATVSPKQRLRSVSGIVVALIIISTLPLYGSTHNPPIKFKNLYALSAEWYGL